MKFENVIICDQIRKEDSGKHLLIGVYPNNIQFPSFPAKIDLSVWVQFRDSGYRRIPMNFRVINSNNDTLMSATGEIDASNQEGLLTIVIPQFLLIILDQTILSFQIREPKKRWRTLKQMPVELKPED